jgi:putative NADH-flavin reductase
MKIVIFGATGFVGKSTLKEALKRDYQVTIFVRDKSKVTIQHKNLTIVQGDVLDPQSVNDILKGQDAVIQVLGYNGKGNGKPTTFTTDATRIIIDGMQQNNVQRLIAISVVGVGNSISFLPKIFTKFILPHFMKWFQFIIDDKNTMEPLIMNSSLAWTVVRSITIKDKPAKGKINATFDGQGMKMSITVGDVAKFLIDQLSDSTHLKQAPTISN